jgi:hypothetical protein
MTDKTQGEKEMKEEWKPAPGFEKNYLVSNKGRIKNLRTGYVLKINFDDKGYSQIRFCVNNKKSTKKIHRLVALVFIENPLNLPQVNHKDGNKKNNNVNNLEWCTRSQNIRHAIRLGLKPAPPFKPVYQINKDTKKTIKRFEGIKIAAKETGTRANMISECCHKKRRKTANGFIWEFA